MQVKIGKQRAQSWPHFLFCPEMLPALDASWGPCRGQAAPLWPLAAFSSPIKLIRELIVRMAHRCLGRHSCQPHGCNNLTLKYCHDLYVSCRAPCQPTLTPETSSAVLPEEAVSRMDIHLTAGATCELRVSALPCGMTCLFSRCGSPATRQATHPWMVSNDMSLVHEQSTSPG